MYGLSSSEEEELSGEGWIPWFCAMKGHEFFAEVDDEYIRDAFNLYGLRNRVQYYDYAIEMVLSSEVPEEDDLTDNQFLEIYRDATDLYALIHARFVASARGLQVMRDKFLRGAFGYCPRTLCDRQHVMPVGTSEELHVGRLQVFCPKCEQLYTPRSKHSDNDGCFFGPSFPHLLLQTFPTLVPLEAPVPYRARLFGFLIHGRKSLLDRELSGKNSSKAADKDRPSVLQDIRTRTIPLARNNEGSPSHSSDAPRARDADLDPHAM